MWMVSRTNIRIVCENALGSASAYLQAGYNVVTFNIFM